jgi:hypothetical protein
MPFRPSLVSLVKFDEGMGTVPAERRHVGGHSEHQRPDRGDEHGYVPRPDATADLRLRARAPLGAAESFAADFALLVLTAAGA